MKKLLLSFSVIVSFFLYTLFTRSDTEQSGVGNPVTEAPPSSSTAPSTNSQPASYKDGSYTGAVTDAFYGNVQIQATIQGGKIADVQFLDYPHDRGTSVEINSQAMPLLKQEAIQAQSANVDIVSGATQTSEAFRESLQSALNKAQS